MHSLNQICVSIQMYTKHTHPHTRARMHIWQLYTCKTAAKTPAAAHDHSQPSTIPLPSPLCCSTLPQVVLSPANRTETTPTRWGIARKPRGSRCVCTKWVVVFFFLHPGWTWHSFVVFSVYISCLLIPGGADCKTLTDDSNIYTFFILASLSVVTTRLAVKKREFMRRLRRRKRTETKVKRIKKEREGHRQWLPKRSHTTSCEWRVFTTSCYQLILKAHR